MIRQAPSYSVSLLGLLATTALACGSQPICEQYANLCEDGTGGSGAAAQGGGGSGAGAGGAGGGQGGSGGGGGTVDGIVVELVGAGDQPLEGRKVLLAVGDAEAVAVGMTDADGKATVDARPGDTVIVLDDSVNQFGFAAAITADVTAVRFMNPFGHDNAAVDVTVNVTCADCAADETFLAECAAPAVQPFTGTTMESHAFTGYEGCVGLPTVDYFFFQFRPGDGQYWFRQLVDQPFQAGTVSLGSTTLAAGTTVGVTVDNIEAGGAWDAALVRQPGYTSWRLAQLSSIAAENGSLTRDLGLPASLVTSETLVEQVVTSTESVVQRVQPISGAAASFDAAAFATPSDGVVDLDGDQLKVSFALDGLAGDTALLVALSGTVLWQVVGPATSDVELIVPKLPAADSTFELDVGTLSLIKVGNNSLTQAFGYGEALAAPVELYRDTTSVTVELNP